MASINKNDRIERVLLDLVEQYIKTAEPVSSGQLLRAYKYNFSAATIRNIMAHLTDAGYLEQPHTSAGRIPTPKGYRYFVDKVKLGAQRVPKTKAKEKPGISNQKKQEIQDAFENSPDIAIRVLSQHLADVTHNMAFAGILGINQFYKEGLRHLLEEPEFISVESIRDLVDYADSLEQNLDKLYDMVSGDIRVFIGEELEGQFSVMAFANELPNSERAIFGILGPTRMHYTENLRLMDEIKDILN